LGRVKLKPMIGALSARGASKKELAELGKLLDEYEKRKR